MRDLSAHRQEVGRAGERLAAGWLEREGCRVVARNYRCRFGEVDLVVEERGELVFVEVRTRTAGTLVGPEESITAAKRRRLVGAAQHYLQATGAGERPWRIDVVAIELDRDGRLQRFERVRSAVE